MIDQYLGSFQKDLTSGQNASSVLVVLVKSFAQLFCKLHSLWLKSWLKTKYLILHSYRRSWAVLSVLLSGSDSDKAAIPQLLIFVRVVPWTYNYVRIEIFIIRYTFSCMLNFRPPFNFDLFPQFHCTTLYSTLCEGCTKHDEVIKTWSFEQNVDFSLFKLLFSIK